MQQPDSFNKPPAAFNFKACKMGKLINNKNWSATGMGPAANWPVGLQTIINAILFSAAPMFVLWGAHASCFYNDAFSEIFTENNNDANSIGEPANECLPELWPLIEIYYNPSIKYYKTFTCPVKVISIFKKGIIDKCFYSFTFITINDTAKINRGLLVNCTKITDVFLQKQAMETVAITPSAKLKINTPATSPPEPLPVSEQKLRNMVMTAGAGLLLLQGPLFLIEMVNEAYLNILGKTNQTLIGKAYFDVVPQLNNNLQLALSSILKTGISLVIKEVTVEIKSLGKTSNIYLNFIYRASRAPDNSITGIICEINDVTNIVKATFAIAENERQFRNMVMHSPLAMVILRGPNFIIETVNSQMLVNVWQKEAAAVLGKPFLIAFPEMESQIYPALLTSIYNSGKAFKNDESVMELLTEKGKNILYMEISYSPLFEMDGTVCGIAVAANDITRQVLTKKRLHQEEARLRLSAEVSAIGSFELNFISNVLVHCQRLPVIYGLAPTHTLTNLQISTLIHPQDMVDIVDKAYTKALTTGFLLFDARIIWADKSVHWIRTHCKMIFGTEKVLTGMIGTVQDITIEKQKDETILQLAAIVASSKDAIVGTTLQGKITTWNDAAVGIFGYTALEMIGKDAAMLFATNQSGAENDFNINSPATNYAFETKCLKKDNSLIDISFSCAPIKDFSGIIIGISKIARDITKQKTFQTTLITSEARFRLLANSMSQFIWTSNNKGHMDYLNEAVNKFTGINTDYLKDKGWMQIIHPDERETIIKKWNYAIANREDFLLEHRLLRHDGKYIWHLSRAVLQTNSEGKITSWVGTSMDINEIKENDQNRDFFISMASHELNTPVTTIKGYVDMLMEEYGGNGDIFLKNALDTIGFQIVQLTDLIADLLDLSKIKAGILQLYKEHFFCKKFITEVIGNLSAAHPTHQFNYIETLPLLIFADKERITQVLTIFLSNAVRYSPNNKIVNITCKEHNDQALISVQDYGIGISKINQSKIFNRFFRVSGKIEKTYPGLGIGLFLAAEIIEKHQGQIGVESVQGQGTTFYFSLPLNKKGS